MKVMYHVDLPSMLDSKLDHKKAGESRKRKRENTTKQVFRVLTM